MIIFYGIVNAAAVIFAYSAYRLSKIGTAGRTRMHNSPDWLEAAMSRALKFGIRKKSDVFFYLMFALAGIASGTALLVLGRLPEGLVMAVMPVVLIMLIINAKKRKAASVFQKNAYKLYKYILNQTAAGVRPGDALKSMYEVVEEKNLRRMLSEACAKYSVSMDNVVLSEGILENIDTPEARSFAMTIRDRIFESRDEKLVGRLEQLMFNRYFAYVQRSTDGVKTRCLVTVVLLCSVIVIMILVPTMMDVQNALNSIFTQ